MVELYFELSSYAVYLAVLLSGIGIVIYTRLNAVLKAFTLYLIVSGAFELVAYSLSRLQQDNLHWLHLYTLVEIVTLSYFFNCVFIRMKVQYPIKIVTGIVLVFCVLNSIFLQPINSFNSYASTLVSVTIIVYCILTFYHLLDKDAEKYKKIRWLVSGLLLYQMTSFIVMAFSHVSIKLDIEIDMIVWFIRLVIMLITKVMFGYVILLATFSNGKYKYSRG